MPEYPAFPLLDFGRFPRGVEMVQGHETFLDVGAGAHFLGGADQHADGTGPHPLKERLFLGVGIGVADGGDLAFRDAGSDQLGNHVVIDAVSPLRRVDAHVAENHLRAACRGRFPPGGGDVADQGVDFRVRGNPRSVAESNRASRASLRPSVVMARALSSRGSTFCERKRS